MKKYIKNIDEIQGVETTAGAWGPFRSDTPPLWDWGCHDIAMCLDIVRKFPNQINWFKDSFPVYPMETLVLRIIPDKEGEYPVHDHNLVAVTSGNIYPNGMFSTMLISP